MQRRKHSREFKLETVKFIKERGVSVAQTSRDLISTVSDAVLEEVAVWQARPLDSAYPLVFSSMLCG